MAISLLFILLLRFTAGLLLWTTIVAVVLLLAYGAYTSGEELLHRRPHRLLEASRVCVCVCVCVRRYVVVLRRVEPAETPTRLRRGHRGGGPADRPAGLPAALSDVDPAA